MIEFRQPARKPATRVIPRNLTMTFRADSVVRTGAGECCAAHLRPGERVLSGTDAGLCVHSITLGEPATDDGKRLVRVVMGQAAPDRAAALLPVAARVSPEDGRLRFG
ncbi:hypothetical protein [Tropicimonas sp.]|uniref:hypothetical protein n=1 Tax=Tropicimonas sp. TaxID=2067044 RepID=UPI003A83F2D1